MKSECPASTCARPSGSPHSESRRRRRRKMHTELPISSSLRLLPSSSFLRGQRRVEADLTRHSSSPPPSPPGAPHRHLRVQVPPRAGSRSTASAGSTGPPVELVCDSSVAAGAVGAVRWAGCDLGVGRIRAQPAKAKRSAVWLGSCSFPPGSLRNGRAAAFHARGCGRVVRRTRHQNIFAALWLSGYEREKTVKKTPSRNALPPAYGTHRRNWVLTAK
ncbi:hypothetical protein B0H14DRAFT_1443554 [Mycena olivaceomarginata]|nr:hypothetical protein B0H14DRAFT_1443554 [Mycena olivaceomarginata]